MALEDELAKLVRRGGRPSSGARGSRGPVLFVALGVAGIAAVIVLVVIFLGDNIKDAFQSTCDAIDDGSTATTCSKD